MPCSHRMGQPVSRKEPPVPVALVSQDEARTLIHQILAAETDQARRIYGALVPVGRSVPASEDELVAAWVSVVDPAAHLDFADFLRQSWREGSRLANRVRDYVYRIKVFLAQPDEFTGLEWPARDRLRRAGILAPNPFTPEQYQKLKEAGWTSHNRRQLDGWLEANGIGSSFATLVQSALSASHSLTVAVNANLL